MSAAPSLGSILVVDDEANLREGVKDNLDACGYSVREAGSGREALAEVKARAFDVILMDYNLPGENGIEVIRRIRAVNAESQILMITAHGTLGTAQDAIAESVCGFLTKPVDFDALKLAIAKAIDKLRMERELRRLHEENARQNGDLRQANETLLNLNQMKSKFMSMASHDLSNTVMALQVNFELLKAGLAPNEEQAKRFSSISTGLAQISRLINDLVDWAAIEKGKLRLEREKISLASLAEEAVAAYQGRAQARGVSIQIEPSADLPPIEADKRRLLQVFSNLLENAIRHTPKGGKVYVGAVKEGELVRFWVRDTGEGISPEEIGRIFDGFYQGAGQTELGRLGLGLTIAKEVVGAHGGRLWAESPGRGKGATFLFTLPAAGKPKTAPAGSGTGKK